MSQTVDPKLRRELAREDLIYFPDSRPGIFRQRLGKKFEYYDADGKKIRERKILLRIKSLIIPPAWQDVWISPCVNGHLQATGIDDRRRKQYLYHPDWLKISQENKFSKMIDFGSSLPKIRQKIYYELRQKLLSKERLLATVVWLLEHTFVRIGNEEYSKENNSFGLTTLHNRHANVRGSEITFKFRGKSGVENTIEVDNPVIARTIKECIDLPGYELFQFIDDEGNRHTVESKDVNLYLKDLTHDDFSAKDFRTWGATNLSAADLYRKGAVEDEKEVKKNVLETVKEVAHHLNNTVSVCRTYYIHPTVIETYSKNLLVPHFEPYAKTRAAKRGLSWNEYALIGLLKKFA